MCDMDNLYKLELCIWITLGMSCTYVNTENGKCCLALTLMISIYCFVNYDATIFENLLIFRTSLIWVGNPICTCNDW
jgi:hypothetical protein